jgi:uncharacterized protein (TIGR02284 family)
MAAALAPASAAAVVRDVQRTDTMAEIHEGVSISDTSPTQEPLFDRAIDELIGVVNDLIELEAATAAALATASEHFDRRDLSLLARQIEAGHQSQVANLTRVVLDLGGEPSDHSRWHELIDVARVRIREIQGDRGIAAALETNETKLRQHIREAVEHVGFTSEERSIIAAGLAAVDDNVARLSVAVD